MPRLAVVDADSQFTYLIEQPLGDIVSLSPAHQCLLGDRALRFAHSVFGDDHDLFPLSVRELTQRQVDVVANSLALAAQEFFRNEKVDIILFPAESTVDPLAFRGSRLPVCDAAVLCGLYPASRRFGDFELRLELSVSLSTFRKSALKILFVDDSFSSGETEARAMAAVAKLAGSFFDTARWLTYVVIARDAESLEQRPSASRRSGPAKKGRLSAYKFAFFASLSPRSLPSSACPLCAALVHASSALEWARAAPAPLLAQLQRIENELLPSRIDASDHEVSILPPDIERLLLAANTRPFPTVCAAIQEESLTDTSLLFSRLLFVALNYDDCLAFVPKAFLSTLFRLSARVGADGGPQYSDLLLFCAALLPTSALLEIQLEIMPILFSQENQYTVGAINALILANSHSAVSAMRDQQVADPATILKIEKKAYAILEQKVIAHFAKNQDNDLQQAYLTDLKVMAERPNPQNELWLAQTLAATLEGGQHATFYKHILQSQRIDIKTLKQSSLQCLGLVKRLLDIAVGIPVENLAQVISKIATEADPNVIRQSTIDAIKEFWDDTYCDSFVYTDTDLLRILSTTRMGVKRQVASFGLSSQPFEMLRSRSYRGGWTFLGPYEFQVEAHFSNLWLNPVHHFYHDRTEDLEARVRRLASDPGFCEGGPVVRVGLTIYESEGDEKEYFAVVFSDRGPSPAMDKISDGRGLSGSRVHLRNKGGGLLICQTSKAPPWLQSELQRWQTDGEIYHNHFVTYFPVLWRARDSFLHAP